MKYSLNKVRTHANHRSKWLVYSISLVLSCNLFVWCCGFISPFVAETIRLEQAKILSEVEKLENSKSVSSSRLTPIISGIETPTGGMKSGQKSVKYYYENLYQYFKVNNVMNDYDITCTRFTCKIYDGNVPVYSVPVDSSDSTSMRNLSMMLFACDYNVQTFLQKVEDGEFGPDFCEYLHTPPLVSQSSDVLAIAR